MGHFKIDEDAFRRSLTTENLIKDFSEIGVEAILKDQNTNTYDNTHFDVLKDKDKSYYQNSDYSMSRKYSHIYVSDNINDTLIFDLDDNDANWILGGIVVDALSKAFDDGLNCGQPL